MSHCAICNSELGKPHFEHCSIDVVTKLRAEADWGAMLPTRFSPRTVKLLREAADALDGCGEEAVEAIRALCRLQDQYTRIVEIERHRANTLGERSRKLAEAISTFLSVVDKFAYEEVWPGEIVSALNVLAEYERGAG